MATSAGTLNEVKLALNSVIQSLIDSQDGFQKMTEHLEDQTLRHYFLAESLKRASFRGALEQVLHQEGVRDVQESGTVSGAILRTWGEIKAHLGGGDHALLVTAEQGEDAARLAYDEAFQVDLPLPIRQILATQAAHVYQTHDFIEAARDMRR